MPNVVKHSFIQGPKTAAKAAAHLRYIQHRPGEDKDPSERSEKKEAGRHLNVVGDDEEKAPGKFAHDFKEAVMDKDQRGRYVHKFILSPSEKNVDMNAYTREVMDCIGRQKGQDLRYAFVVHDNTDNRHAHVVVLGKDMEGHQVRFSRNDYAYMRSYGDRYLEREHGLDMSWDRDMEMIARTQNHNLYLSNHEQNLAFIDRPTRQRTWQTDEDFKHLLNINRNWSESLEGPSREGHLSLGSTWQHDRGRLVEIHDLYQNTQNKGLWQDVFDNTSDQQLKEYASGQLESLQAERQLALGDLARRTGLSAGKIESYLDNIAEQFADEWLALDQALYPEKYEPERLERGNIDLERVADQDKIVFQDGTWLSKYDRTEYLNEVRQRHWDLGTPMNQEQVSKICTWVALKAREGEHCYGEPPLKEIAFERQDIDLERVANKDKIELADGSWISKYDSADYLDGVKAKLWDGPYQDRLDEANYAKLCSWIETKEERGDACFGRPPLKEVAFERQEIDLERVASKDKIELADGSWISKYDSADYLSDVKTDLWKGSSQDRLDEASYAKLCGWIESKEERGDACFGRPPIKDQARDEPDGTLGLKELDDRQYAGGELLEHQRESRELAEMEPIANTHTISIDDALDARNTGSGTDLDERDEPPEFELGAFRDVEYSIEHGPRDEGTPFEKTYEIDDVDNSDPDLDFDSREYIDHSIIEPGIEPELDIEQNGGEGYEIDRTGSDRSDDIPDRGDDDDRRSRSE